MPGEGSVFRRASDGAWLAQISRGPRGGRKTWSRSASTKSEALRKLIALRAELDSPTNTAHPSTQPIGDYLARWVSEARNIRPNTRRGYEVVVTHHLIPTIGHIPIGALEPTHVERMLVVLEPRVSPKYLRNIHATLRRALNQAVRQGVVGRNVAGREYVDVPKVSAGDPDALTDAQLRQLLRVKDSLRPLWAILADCGLRMGEALALTWGDVSANEIRIERALVRVNGKAQPADPKTDRSRRVMPLTRRARAALSVQRKAVVAAGFVPTSSGYVFVNREGDALNGSWVTHRFYATCESAGLDRRPPKVLRATYSSRLYRLGVQGRTIADLMGHARERTTQRHYISTSPEQAREAVRKLA